MIFAECVARLLETQWEWDMNPALRSWGVSGASMEASHCESASRSLAAGTSGQLPGKPHRGGKGWVDQETNMWIVGCNWGTRSKWLERVWEAAQIWDYRDGHRLGNRVCTLRVWCFSNSGLLKKKHYPNALIEKSISFAINVRYHKNNFGKKRKKKKKSKWVPLK